MTTSPKIHGKPPALANNVCEEVRCQQYWHRGRMVEEANVLFLRFGPTWHRLNIDCGVIFWRRQQDAPASFEASEIEASYSVVDLTDELCLRNKRLVDYQMRFIDDGAVVEFVFQDGERLVVKNKADRTSLAA